jgi:hypothetical protein
MRKVDWANLEIVEEWPEFDPSDPISISRKQEQMEQLARLVLDIYFSVKKSKHRRSTSPAEFDTQKVGFIGNSEESQVVSSMDKHQKVAV